MIPLPIRRFRARDIRFKRAQVLACITLPLLIAACGEPDSYAERDSASSDSDRLRDAGEGSPTSAEQQSLSNEEESDRSILDLYRDTKDAVTETLPKVRRQVGDLQNGVESAEKELQSLQDQSEQLKTRVESTAEAVRRSNEQTAELRQEITQLRTQVRAEAETNAQLSTWIIRVLEAIAWLVLAIYLLWAVFFRLPFRLRGWWFSRHPLKLDAAPAAPMSENELSERATSAGPDYLQIDTASANNKIPASPKKPFVLLAPALRRFPKKLDTVRLGWPGMFLHCLLRGRWWGWQIEQTAELQLAHPSDQLITIKLQPDQTVYLDPDCLIAYQQNLSLQGITLSKPVKRMLAGLPLRFLAARGPGRLILGAPGSLKRDQIYGKGDKPIPPSALMA